jgi:large subunit ribosomal protein L24
MPARIKAEDDVVIVGGKDRGKRGKVLRVDPKNDRVFVEGLNMVKRHQRPQQAGTRGGQVGGVIEKEAPIHVSNVMLADPKDGKPTRVRMELIDGKRHRVAIRSGTRID